MKKLIILMTCCIISSGISAQVQAVDNVKRHSVFVELGGNSFIYSLNYDYKIDVSKKLQVAVGSGFSYPIFTKNISTFDGINITPSINLLYGEKKGKFEIGCGLLTGISKSENYYIPSFRIGVRYLWKNGFLFRAGIVTLFPGESDDFHFIVPLPGLSFGYSF